MPDNGYPSYGTQRQVVYNRPKWRWAGPHLPTEPRCIFGFPFLGATPGTYLPFGQIIHFTTIGISRLTADGVKNEVSYTRGPVPNWAVFDGWFGDDYYPEYVGEKYTSLTGFLLYGLMPGLRYRFYWSVGPPLAFDEPPTPSSIRYTEFSASDTYHWLFCDAPTLSGPIILPDGRLTYELDNLHPSCTLLNGELVHRGGIPVGGAGGEPVYIGSESDGAIIYTPEPASYAGPNGAYSTASMGTLIAS